MPIPKCKIHVSSQVCTQTACQRAPPRTTLFPVEKPKNLAATNLEGPAHALVDAVVVHGDVLPELGRHVERPDLVGHARIVDDTAVHVDLVAEEDAGVAVPGQRLPARARDVRHLPDVAVEVVHVDHLGAVEALAAEDVERVLPDDGAVAGRALGRQVAVVYCLPVALLARLVAVGSCGRCILIDDFDLVPNESSCIRVRALQF